MREDRISGFNFDWISHATRLSEIETINVFSFKKAKELVNNHNIKNAMVGIMEDWSPTSDIVLSDGKWKFDGCWAYVWSKWGTPIIVDIDSDTEYECYITVPYTEFEERGRDFEEY